MKNIIVIDKNSGSVKSVENVRTLSSDRASVFLMKLPPESVESFKRDGDDLVIVLKNGQTIIISDFFMKYADGKPVDSVAEEAARNDEEDDRDQDHEDIERNELILEDDEGVAWWGQYPEQWSEFHFTEIEWGDGGGGRFQNAPERLYRRVTLAHTGRVACIAARSEKTAYQSSSASRPLRHSRVGWRKSR